jgi:hypothetical protein
MGKYSDTGLRPLIEKNKRFDSMCIYCHTNIANSREHLPSRIFLDTPYPEGYTVLFLHVRSVMVGFPLAKYMFRVLSIN